VPRRLGQSFDQPRSDCPGTGEQAERRDGNSFRNSFVGVVDEWAIDGTGFCRAEISFRAVAQMVGFGRGRSKMLYLSMEVD
jgi:hypothetical protein